MATEAPKVPRDGTMEVTAKEGLEYLEKESPDLAQKLKDQMKEADDKSSENKNGSGDAPANGNGTAKVPRDNTMVQTAQEGKDFLEKEGGVNEDAKTRSQEKELNSSKTEDKEATKRSADEQNDEAEDAKKAKVEENGDKEAKVEDNGAEKKETVESEEKKE